MHLDETLSTAEAAKILGRSSQTLWRWRKAGTLPAVRVADRVYVWPRKEVEALAARLREN